MKTVALILFFTISVGSLNVRAQQDWFQQIVPITPDLYDIEFVNLNVGYAVGNSGKIIKTVDGGYTWTESNSGTTNTLFDCEFESELVGWVCGAGGLVLRTTNGGETWTPKVILPSDEFHAIHFFTATNGYVAGKNTSTGFAEIYYTLDGGVTFNGISPPAGLTNIKDIVFANLTTGLVLDEWGLYFTTSTGAAWSPITVSTSYALNRIEMLNATNGWMVGNNGTIFYSSTSGTSWVQQFAGIGANLYGISIVDANTIFICGDGGLVMKSINGGNNWVSQPALVTTTLKSVAAIDSSNGWACGIGPAVVRSKTDLDLELQNYNGLSTVCAEQPFPISIKVKNGGSYTVGSGTFTVLDGITQIISYDLITPIVSGETVELVLGTHSVTSNTILTINFTGDDLTANNSALAPINLYTISAHGISGPGTACVGETITMQAYGGTKYYWSNASADSSAQNQSVIFTQAENYIVTITQDNCVFVDTLTVEVGSGDCATSAFTPNGDGKNDFFYIENLPLGDNTVTIYNRWGDEIAIINNYDNSTSYWNGDDTQNKSVVEGTYFYVVKSASTGPFSEGWVQVMK
jgi:gliding motility-associated-like protein